MLANLLEHGFFGLQQACCDMQVGWLAVACL
jgi:hypothetical protein